MTVTSPPALWGQDGTYPAAADRGLLNALWPGEGDGGLRREGLDASVVPGTRDLRISPGRIAMPMRVFDGTTWHLTGGTLLCASDGTEIIHVPPAPMRQMRAIFVVPHGEGIDNEPAGWEFQLVNGAVAFVGRPRWVDAGDYPPSAYPIAWLDDEGGPTLDGVQITVNAGLGGLLIGAGDLAGDVSGPAEDNRVVGLNNRPVLTPGGYENEQPLIWTPGGWLPLPMVRAVYAGANVHVNAQQNFVTVSLSSVGAAGPYATWTYLTSPLWGQEPNYAQLVCALYGLGAGTWLLTANLCRVFDVENGSFDAIRWDGGTIVASPTYPPSPGAINGRFTPRALNGMFTAGGPWNCFLVQGRMSNLVGGWANAVFDSASGAPMNTLTAVKVG